MKKNTVKTRKTFYTVLRVLELSNREIRFSKTEKRLLIKPFNKKIAKRYIPTREGIYRMVDAIDVRRLIQRKRNKAVILCLWQSGVRVNCLLSWTWGIFKNNFTLNHKYL
ncbi:MAG: hypothetical protein ACTSXW_03355 [Candidatus Baldrarchaeia archaeon]